MISVGSLLRFDNHHDGTFESALVLRSYICENEDCCDNDCLDGIDFAQTLGPSQVVDILWDTGQTDTDYHLDGMENRYEVIPP